MPNLFPFKDEILAEVAEKRRLAQEAREKQKAGVKTPVDLEELADAAADAGEEYDMEHGIEGELDDDEDDGVRDYHDPGTSGQRDNSRKAYYREVRKVLEMSDIVLEVLDARDPLGCRAEKVENQVMESGPDKRIVLILNKIDLVPRENVEAWLKYLRNFYPTIAFKASTQTQRKNLSQRAGGITASASSSDCLGADSLISLLKNYSRNKNIKTSITVGVIGFPNVGKSSVINSLKRSRVCGVGSTPGFTKVVQEIHLDKGLKLLDCPGIVFAESADENDPRRTAEVALRNAVKVEQVEDPILPVELILERCQHQHLMILYNIPTFSTSTDFLVHLARVRGRLKRGGIPDLRGAAQTVLSDWNNGRIPFYTVPPPLPGNTQVTLNGSTQKVDVAESSAIVKEWSKEFDLNSLLKGEADDLQAATKSQAEFAGEARLVKMQSTGIGKGEVEMAGQNVADEEDDISSMDEDDEVEQQLLGDQAPKLVSLPPKFAKGETISNTVDAQRQRLFSQHELELMPQTNKDRKKASKKKRKEATRVERDGMAVDDVPMDEGEGDYDFGTYFSKPISGLSNVDKDGDVEL